MKTFSTLYSIAMAFISNTSPITSSEDSNSKTDLDRDNMEEEMHADISDWTLTKRKKLQHMMEFHERISTDIW